MHEFRYVSQTEYEPAMHRIEKMFEAVNSLLAKEYRFNAELVGSAKYGMVTTEVNGNRGFDLDFFLHLSYSKKIEGDAQRVKNEIRKAFDQVAIVNSYGYAEDSTSALTIKVIDPEHSKIVHSCDMAIGFLDDGNNRYILKHNKKSGTYHYCISEDLSEFDDKYEILRGIKGATKELKNEYLALKSMDTNYNRPSYQLFKQAVNNVLNWHYQ